jgi:hypothetical protein
MAMVVRRKKGIYLKGSRVHWHERKAGKEDVRTYKYTDGKADTRGVPGVDGVDKRCKSRFVSVLSVAVGASGVVAVGEGGAHAASPARFAICAAARWGITEPWA